MFNKLFILIRDFKKLKLFYKKKNDLQTFLLLL